MEWAFTGPATLHARLGHLDAAKIAAMDSGRVRRRVLREAGDPSVPGVDGPSHPRLCAPRWSSDSMARGEGVWAGVRSWRRVVRAAAERCPGYGDEKAKIFVAILGKRFGVQPEGWQQAAGQVRRRLAAQRCRHHRPQLARQGSRVEEGGKGRQEGQAGSADRLRVRARRCWTRSAARRCRPSLPERTVGRQSSVRIQGSPRRHRS